MSNKSEEEIVKKIYKQLNTKGDGKINFEDFKKAFWAEGSNRQESSLKNAFTKANKDGKIDLDELLTSFKQPQPQPHVH